MILDVNDFKEKSTDLTKMRKVQKIVIFILLYDIERMKHCHSITLFFVSSTFLTSAES